MISPTRKQDPTTDNFNTLQPAVKPSVLLWLLLGTAAGAVLAVLVLPLWMPALNSAVSGDAPKVYWYLSRSTAFVAYILLWLSMALGIGMTNRLARIWPGAPTAFELHQYSSLLGLAFALFHALVLIGDRYIGYNLLTVLVPFAGDSYRPFWVGVGQIGFYLMAAVGLSFYIRKRIGHKVWRAIHFGSFAMFLLALLHGLTSGTDASTPWATLLYWLTGGSVLFLTVYRVLAARFPEPKASAKPSR